MTTKNRTRDRRKARSATAGTVLTSAANVQRIAELRALRFPSPTGKPGRPRKQLNLFGIA